MSEANKAIARRDYEDVWNNRNLAAIDDLFEMDSLRHGTGESGNERYRQEVTMYTNAFPDLHFAVEDVIAEGDRVVVRWVATGTHRGDLPNVPATGKQVTVAGMSISTVRNGKIVEKSGNWDALGLMQQLGVIPSEG